MKLREDGRLEDGFLLKLKRDSIATIDKQVSDTFGITERQARAIRAEARENIEGFLMAMKQLGDLDHGS